jgi:proline iminopeptidase
VLRSDRVGDGDELSEHILVDDCEAIREELGLDAWSVLGHSFGGRIALRYADQHPDRIRALIFENPSWDVPGTERFRLPRLAAMLDERGRTEEAQHARELAAKPDLFDGGYPAEVLGVLGAVGERWYLHDPEAGERMAEAEPELPDEVLERAGAHNQRIIAQPEFLESLLPMLARLWMPALLISGKFDLVLSPDQIEAFERDAADGRVEVFANSGHFVQLEQAQEYAKTVTGFVLDHARATEG